MKKNSIKIIVIIIITALLSSTLTLGYVYKENFAAMYLQKIIEENYYGGADKEKLADGAMAGMVKMSILSLLIQLQAMKTIWMSLTAPSAVWVCKLPRQKKVAL